MYRPRPQLEKRLRTERRVPTTADPSYKNMLRLANLLSRVLQRMVTRPAEILQNFLQFIRLAKYVL